MTDRRLLVAAPMASVVYEVLGRLFHPDSSLRFKVAHRVGLARSWLTEGRFDAVLVAPILEDGEGIAVVTAAATAGVASIALAWDGGWPAPGDTMLDATDDLVVLPGEWWRLTTAIDRAIEAQALRRYRCLADPVHTDAPGFDGLVAVAPAMRAAIERAERIANSPRPVLILGEAGTGRVTLGAAIHRASPQSQRHLVVIPSADLPDHLLDDIFEGRIPAPGSDCAPCWEAGTILVEEICELTRSRQDQLVQSLDTLPAPPRLIATARPDFRDCVRRGRLLPQLADRLGRSIIELPPLIDREPGDLTALAGLLLGRCAPGRAFAADALQWIAARTWDGNLPELVAFVDAILLTCDADVVRHAHLPQPDHATEENKFEAPDQDYDLPWAEFSQRATDRFEAKYFRQVMQICQGRIERCAQLSGVSRRTVPEKLTKHGIDRFEYRRGRG